MDVSGQTKKRLGGALGPSGPWHPQPNPTASMMAEGEWLHCSRGGVGLCLAAAIVLWRLANYVGRDVLYAWDWW